MKRITGLLLAAMLVLPSAARAHGHGGGGGHGHGGGGPSFGGGGHGGHGGPGFRPHAPVVVAPRPGWNGGHAPRPYYGGGSYGGGYYSRGVVVRPYVGFGYWPVVPNYLVTVPPPVAPPTVVYGSPAPQPQQPVANQGACCMTVDLFQGQVGQDGLCIPLQPFRRDRCDQAAPAIPEAPPAPPMSVAPETRNNAVVNRENGKLVLYENGVRMGTVELVEERRERDTSSVAVTPLPGWQ